MPLGRAQHASFDIAVPDAGVYASRQLREVTAIWQIAYRFSRFVSEEGPVRPGHV